MKMKPFSLLINMFLVFVFIKKSGHGLKLAKFEDKKNLPSTLYDLSSYSFKRNRNSFVGHKSKAQTNTVAYATKNKYTEESNRVVPINFLDKATKKQVLQRQMSPNLAHTFPIKGVSFVKKYKKV